VPHPHPALRRRTRRLRPSPKVIANASAAAIAVISASSEPHKSTESAENIGNSGYHECDECHRRRMVERRLRAVDTLLADPEAIPDPLEVELYAYREQVSGEAAS
jgi:hypothetical protein